MTKYAKLTKDGHLKPLTYIPNVSNPRAEVWDAYALANGYKPYVYTKAPNLYYTESFKELKNSIKNVWTPWSLRQAQEAALDTVQMELDSERQQRITVPCEGLSNGIFCDPDARMMATGLVAMGSNIPEGMTWTDAADEVHPLTTELLSAISKALVGYLLDIQHKADDKRKLIKEATNVDDVWAVISPPPPQL